jgi:nicotinate-nucleotide pyrophosphorylase (carboxylating)
LAGLYVADVLIREWMPGARFTWTSGEGSRIEAGTCILTIEGCRHQILVCERVILNILGRLSGIATNAALWVSNSQIPLAATRKTAWGALDKAAVAVGGGLTHRIHRADALMLKENDLASTAEDGDEGAVRVRKVLNDIPAESIGAFVTVEVRSLDEALAAGEAWAERMLEREEGLRLNILLDNMGPELSRDAVLDIETRGLRQYVTIEASGNIIFDDLGAWQSSMVDVISTSALHRAAPPLDLTCIFEGV